MAEADGAGGGGGWFGSLVTSVQSSFAGVGQDLQEFVQTVTTDTSTVVTETVDTLKEKGNSEGASGMASAVVDVVGSLRTSLATDAPALRAKGDKARRASTGSASGRDGAPVAVLDRAEAQLRTLRHSRATYCDEPEDEAQFQDWKSTFVLGEHTSEISQLLSSDETIRKLHTELIPNTVSYNTFWHRYFYQIFRLKEIDERRTQLVERMAGNDNDEAAFDDWGDDSDLDDLDSPGDAGPEVEQAAAAEAAQVAAEEKEAPEKAAVVAAAEEKAAEDAEKAAAEAAAVEKAATEEAAAEKAAAEAAAEKAAEAAAAETAAAEKAATAEAAAAEEKAAAEKAEEKAAAEKAAAEKAAAEAAAAEKAEEKAAAETAAAEKAAAAEAATEKAAAEKAAAEKAAAEAAALNAAQQAAALEAGAVVLPSATDDVDSGGSTSSYEVVETPAVDDADEDNGWGDWE